MKIAILISHFPPQWIGGTETQTSNLARQLARNHGILVLTRSHPDLPMTEKREGYVIKRLKCINIPIIIFFSHVIAALVEIYKNRKNIDILQCMMLFPNGFIGIIAKKLFKIPTVAWIRGGDWYISRKKTLKKIMISMVLHNSDVILAQTNRIKEEVLRAHPGTKIEVVPNAVEAEGEKANGEDILFVGNLVARKGVKNLILAIKEIEKREYSGLNVTIVGDGPERGTLMKMAEGSNIEFVSRVSPEKVEGYMKKGMMLVLPSIRGEGLPNVILEAMSVGLPVIATKIAGIPDVVNHGETGFLVEPSDPIELANCILELCKNEKLRKKMGEMSLQAIKRYSWASVTNKLEAIYGDILKRYV